MMLLDVNMERDHLRVRAREENNSDNENDGFKSNFSHVMLKVTDITRLEIGREKSTKKSSSSPKQVKSFSVVLRKPVGNSNTFNFEAESPAERDSIIGGIKSVLELTKIPSESRRRRSSQSPHLEDTRSKNSRSSSFRRESTIDNMEKETVKSAANGKTDDIAGNAAVYFDFDLPNDGPEAAIEAEVRNDTGDRASDDDREAATSDSEHERKGRKEKKTKEANEFAITVIEDPAERTNTSIEIAGINWSVDDIFCGIAIGRGGSVPTSPTNNERTLQGKYGGEILWNPLQGCGSKALAAVDDSELAAMGANEISAGPFCTDDVCTTTLKDFTDTMKGIFEMKQHSREGQPNDQKQRLMAEDYIANALGAPTSVAANLLSVKDMWTATPEKPPVPKKKTFQNRSRNWGAQAVRLARLRRQMTFQFADLSEKMPFVQVVSSYDDVERGGRFGKKLTSGLIAKGPQNDSSQFLRAVVDNMERRDPSDSEEEILYYDSDPEDVREMALRRGPRRAIAELKNASKSAKPRREALSDIPMSRINLSRRLRRVDDDIVNEIIHKMKNEEMTLLWHPSQKQTPNRAPFCSKVWIESGIYLIDGTFLLPKLTWVPVFEQSIQSKVLNVTLSNPGTIDLLDVCRVRECVKIDRKIHPFANLECSFVVQTQKDVQLFEARSKEERTRIVSGLRLVIARLASLLMLRDLRAVDEFFGGNSVPGEAPAWARNESSDASSGSS
jgi:hypothetical protein